MSNKIFLGFITCMSLSLSHAQFVNCETMPLVLTSGFVFDTTSITGDAAIVFDMANSSGTDFAYPVVKFDPITPLPPGMTLNGLSSPWAVFASAWNDGDTNTIEVYYDLAQTIPANYMVSFILYASNFAPLTIDSCAFVDTITINLHPVLGTEDLIENSFNIFPNPASDLVNIQLANGTTETWLDIYNMNGQLIRSLFVTQETRLNLSEFSNGIYILKSRGGNFSKKLVVEKN